MADEAENIEQVEQQEEEVVEPKNILTSEQIAAGLSQLAKTYGKPHNTPTWHILTSGVII